MDKYFLGSILVSLTIPALIFFVFFVLYIAFSFPLIIWAIPTIFLLVYLIYWWNQWD